MFLPCSKWEVNSDLSGTYMMDTSFYWSIFGINRLLRYKCTKKIFCGWAIKNFPCWPAQKVGFWVFPEIIIRPNTNAGGCLFGGIFFACHVVSAANLRENLVCMQSPLSLLNKGHLCSIYLHFVQLYMYCTSALERIQDNKTCFLA